MQSSFDPLRLAFFSMIIVVVVGCGEKGPPTGYCVGTMTIDGASPSDNVRIIFMDSLHGFNGSGTVAKDGSYSVQNLRLGEYVVYFEKGGVLVNGDKTNGEISTDADLLTSVPATYRTEAGSPLKKTILEGKNTFEFDVPSAMKK